MRTASCLGLALAAVVAGCGDDAAFDVIVRQGNRPLPAGIDTLQLVVRRTTDDGVGSVVFDAETPALHDGDRLRPWTVRVKAPDGSESRVFVFRAEGLVADTSVVAAEARLAFLAGSRLSVSLVLGGESACDADADVSGCAADAGPDGDAALDDAAEPDDAARDVGLVGDAGDGGSRDAAGRDAATDCLIDRDCDDAMPCTEDFCIRGECAHDTLDGVLCDDGDACTTTLCRSGECVPTGGVVCAAGSCSVAYCDPATGECVDVPFPEGTVCDDGDDCSRSSACDGFAVCIGGDTCGETSRACMAPLCMPSGCVEMPVPDDTVCPGGSCCGGVCTNTETDEIHCGACGAMCAADSCIGGICQTCIAALDCDDALSCTVDSCAAGRCVNALVGDACLIEGTCYALGTSNPDNQCLTCGAAAPTSWTISVGAACDDGLYCTGIDRCDDEGRCHGTPLACPDRVCSAVTCNENLDMCESTPLSGRAPGCAGTDTCCDGTCMPAIPGCT